METQTEKKLENQVDTGFGVDTFNTETVQCRGLNDCQYCALKLLMQVKYGIRYLKSRPQINSGRHPGSNSRRQTQHLEPQTLHVGFPKIGGGFLSWGFP